MSDSIKNKVTEEELRRAFVGNSISKEKPHNKGVGFTEEYLKVEEV